MALTRIFDILNFQLQWHPNEKILNHKVNGKWRAYSSQDFKEEVYSIAQGLLDAGFQKGDKIIMVPKSASPAMIFLDLAAQLIGLLSVIVHATFTNEQLAHVLEEVAPKYIFFASDKLLEKFDFNHHKKPPSVVVSSSKSSAFYNNFYTSNFNEQLIDNQAALILPEDIALIVYTSGSTGTPKGVMLSHRNIMSNLAALMALFPVQSGSIVLSYLPFSHILERAVIYNYMALGMQVYLLENVAQLDQILVEVKPQFFTAVPRIVEKIFERLQTYKSGKGWVEKRLLTWAINVGLKYEPYKKFRLHYSVFLFIARYFLLGSVRKAMGGRLEGMLIGGAHLNPSLAQLLEVAGIPIREGYGLTETSPVVTINRYEPGLHQLGTVGLPLSNVQIKIDTEDTIEGEGEILVKGPNVTAGYYKRPDLTSQLFNAEGWMKTGDVGTINAKGFLTITDRKKDIFKTSAGKYIAPAVLENHFKASEFINQMLIIGFHRPAVTALIVPNFTLLEKWAKENNIHWTSPKYMVHNIKVKSILEEEIDQLNQTLAKFKRILNHCFLDEEWTVENNLLSASHKPIRKAIEGQYAKEIEKMYK